MSVLEPTAQNNMNEDRPILSATKCRPMTLVSGNKVHAVPLGGASNESGVDDDLVGYFFGK